MEFASEVFEFGNLKGEERDCGSGNEDSEEEYIGDGTIDLEEMKNKEGEERTGAGIN